MNRCAVKGNDNVSGATTQAQKIIEYIEANGHITDAEIQELFGLKKTRAFTLAKQMRDIGLIKAEGRGSNKVYIKA